MLLLNNISAQNKKYKEYNVSLPVIEVVDSNFYHLLDYVLDLDRKCTFFSDSLWYSLFLGDFIYSDENHDLFQFTGNTSRGFYLENSTDFHIGALKYGNHYFFIRATILPQDVLRLTNNQYFLNGYYEKPSYHIDDSWPMHIISYHNGDYYFIKTAHDKIRCSPN